MFFTDRTLRHALVLAAAITSPWAAATTSNTKADSSAADSLAINPTASDTIGPNALRGVHNSRPFKHVQPVFATSANTKNGMTNEVDDITIHDEPNKVPETPVDTGTSPQVESIFPTEKTLGRTIDAVTKHSVRKSTRDNLDPTTRLELDITKAAAATDKFHQESEATTLQPPSFRGSNNPSVKEHAGTLSAVRSATVSDEAGNKLLIKSLKSRELSNCWGKNAPEAAWHPVYGDGWTNGHCTFRVDCNSPSYSSELSCCLGAYAGQVSEYCLSQLPNPPTLSPTEVGGLEVFYPDYATPWPEAGCINTRPMPNGRPTYASQLECCKGAYAGQMSGKCLSMLPSPPSTSPTTSSMTADFYYPVYEVEWANSGCSNKLPLPFKINDRPTYATHLECCKGAYGGQMSGVCLQQLDNPPTLSPTLTGGLTTFYYPDYETPWDRATCLNTLPLPFTHGGRPTYSTKEACCAGAYGGQVSKACISSPVATAVGYEVTTTTTTIPFSSYITLNQAVTIPTDPIDKQSVVDTLKDTIKAMIEQGLGPGQSVTSLTIKSIGGQAVRRLHHLLRQLSLSPTDIEYDAEIQAIQSFTIELGTSSSGAEPEVDSQQIASSIASSVASSINEQVSNGSFTEVLQEMVGSSSNSAVTTAFQAVEIISAPNTITVDPQAVLTNTEVTTSLTDSPTASPTPLPTQPPTTSPPTQSPTTAPTAAPTTSPTGAPTTAPTTSAGPTTAPTTSPTGAPTTAPTTSPTAAPSTSPTGAPTAPTTSPTSSPTAAPTTSAAPTKSPTSSPTSLAFADYYELADAVRLYGEQVCATDANCAIGERWGHPIGDWDVSQVTSFDSLFADASFNEDISGWDTSKVTSMNYVFSYKTEFNQDISAWNTSEVTSMTSMFNQASKFNQDISGWDTSKVTNMDNMFQYASQFNQNLCIWREHFVEYTKSYYGMFTDSGCPNNGWNDYPQGTTVTDQTWCYDAQDTCPPPPNPNKAFDNKDTLKDAINLYLYNQDCTSNPGCEIGVEYGMPLGAWNLKDVTNLDSLFKNYGDFNVDISGWDTSSVTSMREMFMNDVSSTFNQDISGWDTSKVTDMTNMFYRASAFSQNLCPWGQHYNSGRTYTDMFLNSGCGDTGSPFSEHSSWCVSWC